MKKKAVIIGLVVLAAAVSAMTFVYFKNKNSDTAGISVDAASVTRKTIEGSVTTKGNVELKKLETIAAEAQAKILSVNVKVGDTVKKGDVLVEYDPKSKEAIEESLTEARLLLRSAELALSGAELPAGSREITNAQIEVELQAKRISDAQIAIERADIAIEGIVTSLETAKRDYESAMTLYNAGALSKADLDAAEYKLSDMELSLRNNQKSRETLINELNAANRAKSAAEQSLSALRNKNSEPAAQNQIEQAEINVEQQELRISQLERQLEEFKLVEVSPINGDIINVYVENGWVTKPGDRLINIGDTNELIIATDVVEYDVPNIAIGQEVELSGEALRDKKLKGEVISIAPTAAPKQVGNAVGNVVKTEIALSEVNTVLKPGFSVSAKILIGAYEDALTVPLLSLVYDKEGEYSVFVIKSDNTIERRPVSVIDFAALDAVVEGVTEGEKIVASPSFDLEEGTAVTVND